MTCSICRFETELDDVVVTRGSNECICLLCFARETGTELPMPNLLRRDLIAVLAEVAAL
jgi:hypothetical protein